MERSRTLSWKGQGPCGGKVEELVMERLRTLLWKGWGPIKSLFELFDNNLKIPIRKVKNL